MENDLVQNWNMNDLVDEMKLSFQKVHRMPKRYAPIIERLPMIQQNLNEFRDDGLPFGM